MSTWRLEWVGNIKGDILAGVVVALALIPEAVAFSIIAGVDPMVGLYSSFIIAVVISFVGGRPGMISAATGAMALLMIDLVAEHGLHYLLAATILTGFLQIIFGVLKLARYMKFIPRSVIVGFVNALAILIFTAQLPNFIGEEFEMYKMVAGTLLIIYLLPYVTKQIPSALVAIIVITTISILTDSTVRTVGDMGQLPEAFPSFYLPNIPLSLETLAIIFPYSIGLAVVGLVESLLTSTIVDDLTDTTSNKNRESRGQGIANIVAGLFGGMAGCAMIGQSIINVKSGGRGRLSAFVAGSVLILLIVFLGDLVGRIPMAALVGVMFMVAIGTFDWNSIRTMKIIPITDTIVMFTTVIVVIFTHNLAKGVIAGIILSTLFFVAKISKVGVEKIVENESVIYKFRGELFFASVSELLENFDYDIGSIRKVILDFNDSHLWDDSSIAAIDKIVVKFEVHEVGVEFSGLDKSSTELISKLSRKLSTH